MTHLPYSCVSFQYFLLPESLGNGCKTVAILGATASSQTPQQHHTKVHPEQPPGAGPRFMVGWGGQVDNGTEYDKDFIYLFIHNLLLLVFLTTDRVLSK